MFDVQAGEKIDLAAMLGSGEKAAKASVTSGRMERQQHKSSKRELYVAGKSQLVSQITHACLESCVICAYDV